MAIVFFFFKQKTEYEVRISDWSSDVCSSDLDTVRDRRRLQQEYAVPLSAVRRPGDTVPAAATARRGDFDGRASRLCFCHGGARPQDQDNLGRQRGQCGGTIACRTESPQIFNTVAVAVERSEEHTSELQSLMRNSYAVFCLK